LKELGKKTTVFRSEFKKKKSGVQPDFKGLRDILSESGLLDEKERKAEAGVGEINAPENIGTRDKKQDSREGVLRPGDSVKI